MALMLNELSPFQQELLKQEIDLIDKTIARIDQVLYNLKQWTAGIWTGGVALIIEQGDKPHALFLALCVIPFAFGILDIIWKQQLLLVTFREKKISRFINGYDDDFKFLDPIGKFYQPARDGLEARTGWLDALCYKEKSLFYVAIILVSISLYLYYPS